MKTYDIIVQVKIHNKTFNLGDLGKILEELAKLDVKPGGYVNESAYMRQLIYKEAKKKGLIE